MSSTGGEDSPAKGRQFDEAVFDLLTQVGYRIVVRHRDGFDLVADPPRISKIGTPVVFAPRQRTGFEFKGGKGPSVESAAKDLARKVKNAKKKRKLAIKKIDAGVLVFEGYIQDRIKLQISLKHKISVWDFRTLLFLLSRVQFIQSSSHSLKPVEFQLDTSTTVLYETLNENLQSRPTIRFACGIFYQSLTEKLSTERMEAIVGRLTTMLESTAKKLTLPAYANVSVFSLAGFTDDITSASVGKLLISKSAGRIIYDSQNVRVSTFETAPWSFLLPKE